LTVQFDDPALYGDRIADIYDDLHRHMADVGPMVSTLAGLANGGRALELGIGTGRVALPLAEKRIEVHGIDASAAMVAKLKAKSGADKISVSIGNFRDVAVEGEFVLIFVIFNTFFALLTQEDQVECFRNVAKRLTKDGVFVIEAFVPDLSRFVRNQNADVTHVEADQLLVSVANHDPVNQRVVSQHVAITEDTVKLYPLQIRYAWPSELDLMAQIAGMRLRERWSDWEGRRFTPTSTSHISVYEQA
jgi:SAM-dependent methyltransferase